MREAEKCLMTERCLANVGIGKLDPCPTSFLVGLVDM